MRILWAGAALPRLRGGLSSFFIDCTEEAIPLLGSGRRRLFFFNYYFKSEFIFLFYNKLSHLYVTCQFFI